MALATVLGAGGLVADAHAAGGWAFAVDAGAFAENTYVGSDEMYVTPLPAIRATRTAGTTTWFLALPLDGLGVSHRHGRSGLTTSLAVNFGGRRGPDEYSIVGFPVTHSERTRARLEGTPEVATPLFVEAAVEYPVAGCLFAASLGWHPTTIGYDDAAAADATRQGFLLSLSCLKPVPLTSRLTVVGILGVGLMDGAYADAWFGIEHGTAALDAFAADAGVRDATAAVYAQYRVSGRIDLSVYGSAMLLAGDAAASPYTVDRHQQTFLLRTTYTF
ncbi:MAG: MipA/OmpV family protein [Candidatus Krumholzibacteriia bacterium]